MLNALRNLSSRCANQNFAKATASTMGAFVGRGVGGAYATMFTRQIAGYAIPKATANTLLQLPTACVKNMARNVMIENLAVTAFPYGALAGSALGAFVGAGAVQLSCYAAKAAYGFTAEKWQEYEQHKKLVGEYKNLTHNTPDSNQLDGLEVEDDYFHLSKRVVPNTNAYSLVTFNYNNSVKQNSSRYIPQITGGDNQNINPNQLAYANAPRLRFRQS
jgi:hypothetical protein